MHRLVINPDTASAWEISLNAGPNLIGRDPVNDFPVEHDSVSHMHCQVTVTDSTVSIKDLGSDGGTFLNGEPISESILQNGQTVQIGEVLMRFEMNPVEDQIAVPADLPQESLFCKYHPKGLARHLCPQCGKRFCDLCVNRRTHRGKIAKFCRSCGVECESILAPVNPAVPPKPFAVQLQSAFAYPFKGDGAILLLAGAVFFYAVGVLARFSSIIGLLLMVACAGYLISYYQRILLASAIGEDRMPDWPDFTDFGELLSPIVQFVGTFAFSFGPAIAISIFAPEDTSWNPWGQRIAIVAGCIYFPMAFTAVTMADSLSALNPLVVIPSIMKILLAYLLAVAVLAAVFGINWLGSDVVSRILPIPIVPGILSEFVGIYLAAVEMRILGLLYRSKKDELGWFSR
jgi:hypothetical protein